MVSLRRSSTLAAALTSILVSIGSARAESDYIFELDGKPYDPYIRSLNGTPDAPAPGDVGVVYRIPLVLDEPGHYRLEVSERKESKETLIHRVTEDERRLVGVHLRDIYSDDPKPEPSILTTLKPDALSRLTGIYFERWDETVREAIEPLDLKNTALRIADDALDQGKLADLPPGVVYLSLVASSSQARWDYASLRGQTQLRFLELDRLGNQRFDVSDLEGAGDLRFFCSGGVGLDGAAKLGQLTALRDLDLSWDEGTRSIEFAARLPKLKRLSIHSTGVTDLSPIREMTSLREVFANRSKAGILPEAPVESLERLEVMSTGLSSDDVAAFAARNPQTEIWHDWGSALRRAADGITKLRVRSGGTCHRRIEEEKTLFEVTDENELKNFLDMIRMETKPLGGHCMCCGDPSFELYRGDEIVVTLGFHHGRTLRWPGGWPGDGLITGESAEDLCRFLDRHGVERPLRDLVEGRKRGEAIKRRYATYSKLIPKPLVEALRAGGGSAAFAEKIPDMTVRGELCFRLFGCHEDSWNLSAGLDEMLEDDLLPEFGAEWVRDSLFPKAKGDPYLTNGLARWVFGYNQRQSYDGKMLGEFLVPFAKYGLAHPREETQRWTLNALARIPNEASIGVLRAFLAGEIETRELAEALEVEPGGMVSYVPGQLEVPDNAGVRATAAIALAKLGDRESADAIGRLAEEAGSDADREAYQKALEMLRP